LKAKALAGKKTFDEKIEKAREEKKSKEKQTAQGPAL
jgi:hypothetical protein